MIITVGLDISKDKIDYYYDEGRAGEIANTRKAIKALFASLKEVRLVVMESTGKYHRAAQHTLSDLELPVRVINPYQSRHFANALNLFCKTDKVDAKMLWQFGKQMPYETTECPSKKQEQLLDLSRHLDDLKQVHQDIVKRKELSCEMIQGSLKRVADKLAKEIKHTEQALCQLIKSDEDLNEKLQILVSIPGVGRLTGILLLCLLRELGSLNKRQVAALAGLAPMNQDSGTKQGKRRLRGGRRDIKSHLYMPMLGAATQHNERLIACYQRLVAAGKPKKVALVACMRKLIVWANALLASGKKWDNNFPITA